MAVNDSQHAVGPGQLEPRNASVMGALVRFCGRWIPVRQTRIRDFGGND